MAVRIYVTDAGTALTAAEIVLLKDAVREHGRAVLLVPSAGERDVCRRALADADVCAGVEVVTPVAWVASLWGLFGDGRILVSGAQRLLLLADVLAGREGRADGTPSLGSGPGTVHMLADMARDCLPYALARGAGEGARVEQLSPAERAAIKVLAAYDERLRKGGLVEPSAAATRLAAEFSAGLVPASVRFVAVRGIPELPEYLLELLGVLSGAGSEIAFMLNSRQADMVGDLARRFACEVQSLEGEDPDNPAPSFVEVSGPSARDASYAQVARELLTEYSTGASQVVIAAPDPLALFRSLAPRLAAAGIASQVEAALPFSATRAGQAYTALTDLLNRVNEEEPAAWWPAPELPDWIRSPFSGIGPGAAHTAIAFDTSLRKTRKLDKQALFARLDSLQSRVQNEERTRAEEQSRAARPVVVKAVIDALDQDKPARALQLMREAAAQTPVSAFGIEGAAAQQNELAALQGALDFLDVARGLGVAAKIACALLPDIRVRASCRAVPAGSPGKGVGQTETCPQAVFRTLRDVASSTPETYDAVLLADASAAAYPLAERESAKTLLARKLGCAGIRLRPSAQQLDLFTRSLQAARTCAALAYVAHDAQADICYPAQAYTVLKEARGDAATPLAGAVPSEGALFSNLDPAGGAGARVDTEPRRVEHVLADNVIPFLLPRERAVAGRAVTRALSASQVENYLSCPYRWFVSNRVSTRRLDVEFGPIEQGNFAHDVMQRFHERIQEAGMCRVTPQNLDACLEQMDEALHEMREDHAHGKYTHGKYATGGERPRPIRGPLVALDELERNQIDALLPKFHEVVRYESTMLPIFEPSQFEYSFDKEGVTYAGRPLGGRIDRVDVAPSAGDGERFVVIDYKNRATVTEYACPDPSMMFGPGDELPAGWLPGRNKDKSPKVQALMYASAYQTLIKGSAQGAVYLGLRGPRVAGAVSDALADCEPPAFPQDKVSEYPGKKTRGAKQDGDMNFSDLLECVEYAVAGELDRLEQGAIAPRPASDSCAFCPLTMCEKRR